MMWMLASADSLRSVEQEVLMLGCVVPLVEGSHSRQVHPLVTYRRDASDAGGTPVLEMERLAIESG